MSACQDGIKKRCFGLFACRLDTELTPEGLARVKAAKTTILLPEPAAEAAEQDAAEQGP